MISNIHPDRMQGQGRETLSALFDGELHGDAARFAMKRLGHDPQWRQAFGNWQLLGDALRGHASSVAPGDFAARVAAGVAAESLRAPATTRGTAAEVAIAAVPAATGRRRWVGGAALAASVAMVAMFVARPFSQDAGAPGGPVTPAPIELTTAPAPAGAPPALPDAALQVGAVAIAAAEVPRRAGERRSRGQSQRVALRASRRQLAVAATAGAPAATVVAVAQPAQHANTNPFHPPHVEVVSRPWPRAVLPGSQATAAFTASYGASTAGSPSFYPFEPRLPSTIDTTSVPDDAGERRR